MVECQESFSPTKVPVIEGLLEIQVLLKVEADLIIGTILIRNA